MASSSAQQHHKREVYYHVMNPDGDPYEGDDVNALELSSNAPIALFRTKVRENQYPSITVPPNRLQVYLNRAAFNNKGPPLRHNDRLGALGEDSDDNAIVVVVEEEETKAAISPFREWFPTDEVSIVKVLMRVDEWRRIAYNGNLIILNDTRASQDSQEYKDVDKIEDDQEESKVVNFKSFAVTFPVLFQITVRETPQQVFVRPCYEEIFKLLLQRIEQKRLRISVTGNPGIGKSMFYAYCTYRFATEPALLSGRKLIVNTRSIYHIFDKESDSFRRLSTRELEELQGQAEIVRLVDGDSSSLHDWQCTSILFASPGLGKARRQFLKDSPYEYVMPPWTFEELNIAGTKLFGFTESILRERYSSFGGITRFVFAENATLYKPIIGEALSAANSLEIIEAVEQAREVDKRKYVHRLLNMYPLHRGGLPYTGFYLTFALAEVAEMIYKLMVKHCNNELRNFIIAEHEDARVESSRSWLFEMMCHRLWGSAGADALHGRSLMSNVQDPPFTIEIPAEVETVTFDSLEDIPEFSADTAVYYRPRGKNFPCIDAIFWDKRTCHLLQMTVAKEHNIVHAPLVEILNWYKQHTKSSQPPTFVFVVPAEMVKDYKRQQLVTGLRTVHSRPNIEATNLAQYVVGVNVVPLATD